ncbi:MAG: hypothetical protein K2L85_01765 [Paramuribaculum sp.]|nr:hypothetical protein [Paramuribaculum sp.]
MIRLLYIVIISVLFVFPFNSEAQTNTESKIEELSVKVDSLTHQIDYFRMSYEMYVLNTDLKLFTQDVNSQIKDMKMNIYHHDCDRDMYRMYSHLYDSYRYNLKSIKGLIESKQQFFIAMVIAKEWSEEELNVLTQSYDMTKGLFLQAELALDMMKNILDIYHKRI